MPGPGRGPGHSPRCSEAEKVRHEAAAGAAPPRSGASEVPRVRQRRRSAQGPVLALLALLALAALPMGQLAAAPPGGLPQVRRAPVLVEQPQERQLPPLWDPRAGLSRGAAMRLLDAEERPRGGRAV